MCGAAMDAEGIEISQDMLCAGGQLNKDACAVGATWQPDAPPG
jgi:hypothetical protein